MGSTSLLDKLCFVNGGATGRALAFCISVAPWLTLISFRMTACLCKALQSILLKSPYLPCLLNRTINRSTEKASGPAYSPKHLRLWDSRMGRRNRVIRVPKIQLYGSRKRRVCSLCDSRGLVGYNWILAQWLQMVHCNAPDNDSGSYIWSVYKSGATATVRYSSDSGRRAQI